MPEPTRRQADVAATDHRSYVVIATAGHVDHGKSSLIEALTGTHPDRLPEERRREMTIELGFASLVRPDGGRIALIDVPGHERLVETMVAGASGIDAALLVVAADDGPMPQTLEHLEILRLLDVNKVVVALSRIDLVDADWLALVRADLASRLAAFGFTTAPIVPVSARRGDGIGQLRSRLLSVLPLRNPARPSEAAWLPLDRVFRKQGLGTVVAGTLVRGQLWSGCRVGIEPAGTTATIRQIQRHGETIAVATAGQRVALNLAGRDLDRIARGDVLSDQPIRLSRCADVLLRTTIGPSPSLRNGQIVRLCVGATAIDATLRLAPSQPEATNGASIAQLRLSRPVPLSFEDRFVLRRPSPAATLGGGVVLDPGPDLRRWGRPDRVAELVALASGDPVPVLRRRLESGPVLVETALLNLPRAAQVQLQKWLADGDVLLLDGRPRSSGHSFDGTAVVIAASAWLTFRERLTAELIAFHERSPAAIGPLRADLPRVLAVGSGDLDHLLRLAQREGSVVLDGPRVRLPAHRPSLSTEDQPQADELVLTLRATPSGCRTSATSLAADALDFLERDGLVVRLGHDRLIATEHFEEIGRWVLREIGTAGMVGLVKVRNELGLSRGAAQCALDRLDQLGVTQRDGLMRTAGPAASAWLERHPG